jgi:hypothetical protein
MEMVRFWTSYWRGANWLGNAEFSEVRYSGGNLFKQRGMTPGDVVYIVSVQRGELFLGGRMQIAEIISRDEAVRRRGRSDLYDAPQWLVGKSGTGSPLHLHRIVAPDLARDLRFISSTASKIKFKNGGGLDEQTLRTPRELSPESALLLDEVIQATDELPRNGDGITVSRHLLNQSPRCIPEEITSSTYQEGSVEQILVNRYERDPSARRACIDHYGAICSACQADLASRYGLAAAGLIHVHHLLPLSSREAVYHLDPVRDLRPVCPNCHSVIHRRAPPYSIEEVRAFLLSMER